jgi:hypothetical protein
MTKVKPQRNWLQILRGPIHLEDVLLFKKWQIYAKPEPSVSGGLLGFDAV